MKAHARTLARARIGCFAFAIAGKGGVPKRSRRRRRDASVVSCEAAVALTEKAAGKRGKKRPWADYRREPVVQAAPLAAAAAAADEERRRRREKRRTWKRRRGGV